MKNIYRSFFRTLVFGALLSGAPAMVFAQSVDTLYSEIFVEHYLKSNYSRISYGDTLHLVRPGETFTSVFTVQNLDVFTPDSIFLFDVLPTNAFIKRIDQTPYFTVWYDSLVEWTPFTLAPGEIYEDSLSITLQDSILWSDIHINNTMFAEVTYAGENYACYPSYESVYLSNDLSVWITSGPNRSNINDDAWESWDDNFYYNVIKLRAFGSGSY